ncbi:MAG: peptide chain release factor N(5)-glutamine methyltransferase [bacterium]
MIESVEVGSILNRAKLILREAGISSPDVDAEIIISSALGIKRAELYINSKKAIPDQSLRKIEKMVEMRASRIPLQRILGRCEFMALEFKISEDVFIPRPETEILVETVLAEAHSMASPIRALEIGTGCGVIAVSLCYYLDRIKVVATDISMKAILIARENGRLNGVSEKMEFVVGDAIEFIKHSADSDGFDIIVSNPPYIKSDEIGRLEPEVRFYDPRVAIDGGSDGLRFYRRIADGLSRLLKANGILALEIDYRLAEDVSNLLQACGLVDITVIKDLSGFDRVIKGRKIKNG